MKRRRVVATCGAALAAFAGCVRRPGSTGSTEPAAESATEPPTDSPKATAAPPPENASVAVDFDTLQPAIAISRRDDIVVHGSDGRQYLFLRVEVSASELPERSAFGFSFDGSTHSPVDPYDVQEYRLARTTNGDGPDAYDGESGTGWLLFDLPETGDASDAALTWGASRWHPGGLPRERLAAAAPELSLDWSVPKSLTYDVESDATTAAMEFSVTNGGDQAGWFVAGLNRADFVNTSVETVGRLVPAGETGTWEFTDEIDYIEELSWDDPEANYVLNWIGGQRERRIELVPEDDS